MIVRPHRHWFVRLFAWHGSVLPAISFRLCLNLLMSLLALWLLNWYETLGIATASALHASARRAIFSARC